VQSAKHKFYNQVVDLLIELVNRIDGNRETQRKVKIVREINGLKRE